MNFQEWQASGQYFDYNNNQIFYQEANMAAPDKLLLIHGFPTASWDWHRMWNQLTERFHVLAPDMIGFGFSDKPRNYHYSIADQADIMEALLQIKNIKKFYILAHDYGDTVAQEMLARFAERQEYPEIRSVCFLNGGLIHGVHRPRLVQQLLNSPIGMLLSPLLGRSSLASNFKAIFGKKTQPTEQEIDEFWALIKYNNGKRIFYKLIRYMSERKVYYDRWVGILQTTKVPLRLIDGVDDPISGWHLAERYKQLVPDPDVILLENIGHYPNVEAPSAVWKHYYDFIQRKP